MCCTERRRTPLRRATLQRMADIYARRFADADGRLRATFEIAWLSGWAPHESQQKPLKPGSADAAACRRARHAGNSGRREAAALTPAAINSCCRRCLDTWPASPCPEPVTTAMMAPAMPAAIIAYSMAVAPLSSRTKSRRLRIARELLIDESCSVVVGSTITAVPSGARSAVHPPEAFRNPAAGSVSPRRASAPRLR